jgi:hypothetical protein
MLLLSGSSRTSSSVQSRVCRSRTKTEHQIDEGENGWGHPKAAPVTDGLAPKGISVMAKPEGSARRNHRIDQGRRQSA